MTRQASNKVATRRLVILAVGTFVLGIDGFVVPGLLPRISASLSVSIATAGQLTTVFAVAYAIGSPVIATLTGRMDRRVVIAAGMIVFLVGMVCQAVGPNFALVLAGRVVAALGAAAFQSNAFALAGVLAPPERRAQSFAVIAAGASLAAVFGVPFGLAVAAWLGWRGTMWTITALAAVAAVLALLGVPSVHLPATTMRERVAVLAKPNILILLAVSALVLAPLFLLSSYAAALVEVSEPTSSSLLLVALLVYGIGYFIGNRLAGRYADRFDSLASITAALVVVFCGAIALRLVEHWYVPTLAALFVLGLAGSLLFIPQVNRLFIAGGKLAAIALSLNGSMNYVGTAIGAAIGGLVLSTAGVSWLAPAAAILAALVLVFAQVTAPERRHSTEAVSAPSSEAAAATSADSAQDVPDSVQ